MRLVPAIEAPRVAGFRAQLARDALSLFARSSGIGMLVIGKNQSNTYWSPVKLEKNI